MKAGRVSFLILYFCLAIVFPRPAAADSLSARVAIEKAEMYVGESFTMQIQIEGHDAPDTPDLSGITDFTVRSLGGQQNSSSSITAINGRMTRTTKQGYIFSYKLTPARQGRLTIPSLKVSMGGQTITTRPVVVTAYKPKKTNDFKLRMNLSSSRAYVGEPIILNVTWYIGKDVEKFHFNLPLLSDKRFDIVDTEVQIDPYRPNNYLRISLNDEEVIAEKGQGELDGTEFMTVRFKKVIIPKTSGSLTLPLGTVACNALVGYKKSRRRHNNMFDSFFNDDFFFGRRKRAVYQKFVIPSNQPVLHVTDLPAAGRPPGFNGLVGRYSIHASATPIDVNVGDPITLTIEVTGSEYLDNVSLPPLDRQPMLSRDFKIPQEMAPGKVEGSIKRFTQTFRATHPNVKAIPALELPYFDVEKGEYRIARSEPIPLHVKATKVVTAQDAEGIITAAKAPKSKLESWAAGIAHNYEDLSVLENQAYDPAMWFHSPIWVTFMLLPPFSYFMLLGSVTVIRKQNADPASREAKHAYGKLVLEMNALKIRSPQTVQAHALVLETLRRYLGKKLRLSAGAITFRDVERKLHECGVADELVRELRQVFDRCEAGRYSGGSEEKSDVSEIINSSLTIFKAINRKLK